MSRFQADSRWLAVNAPSLPLFGGTLVATLLTLVGCEHRNPPPRAPRTDAGADVHLTVEDDGPTGTIEGTVTLNGVLPPPEALELEAATAQRAGCAVAARNLYAHRFGVSAPGVLPDALVTADARSTHPPLPRRRVITFRDCSIEPRFMVMSLNDQLWLHADTHEYHLPKVEGLGATIAQLLQPTEDQQKLVTRPGRYIVHSINYPNWMQTPLIAVPNWFYDQANAQGHYRIEHVPVGNVTVHAWYPGVTPVDRTVVVRQNAVAQQDFVLTAPPPAPPTVDAGTVDAGPVPP